MALSRLWRLEPILPPPPTAAAPIAAAHQQQQPADALALESQERSTLHYRLLPLPAGEGEPLLFEHQLATGRVREFGPGAGRRPATSAAAAAAATTMGAAMDDGFLPSPSSSSSSAPSSASSSWASLDFLYVEHAAHAHVTAREEAGRRAVAQAVAASAGQPLSLGEIKRKEAERREAAAAAGGKAPVGGAAGALMEVDTGAEGEGNGDWGRPQSPRLGMGMEGSVGGGHLSALVPRGRATLNLLVTWSVREGDGEGDGAWRRVGQHQVLNHAVRPLTLDPTTAAPLTITVQYPPVVRGRVGPCGLLQRCEAEVLVTVHNRMTDMEVDFAFEALTNPSGKRQSANRAAASPSFVWCVHARMARRDKLCVKMSNQPPT